MAEDGNGLQSEFCIVILVMGVKGVNNCSGEGSKSGQKEQTPERY